jgi:predicted dehydrogenase
MISDHELTRRQFIAMAAGGASVLWASSGCMSLGQPRRARILAPDQTLNLACVGVGGRGAGNLDGILKTGERIVALCDVDADSLEKAAEIVRAGNNKKVRLYRDYRRMLARETRLHGVLVSTPDHMHAPIAEAALKRGLHVYCEKPMTRTIDEGRRLVALAEKTGAVTTLGTQSGESNGTRRNFEIIQSGLLGPIRAVHAWTNRPFWPQGITRPAGADPVPPTLDWDLWLGVAPVRPFKNQVYHPFKWRGWIDFGTGSLGDMGCHILNLPARSLKMDCPDRISAETSEPSGESWPKSCAVRYTFPARNGMEPCDLFWYDGSRLPPEELLTDIRTRFGSVDGSGSIMVGDEGILYARCGYGDQGYLKLKGDEKFLGVSNHPRAKNVPVTLPRSPGMYQEWTQACKGGPEPFMSFRQSGALNELVLLGCVAIRAGRPIRWNVETMTDRDGMNLSPILQSLYRTGW